MKKMDTNKLLEYILIIIAKILIANWVAKDSKHLKKNSVTKYEKNNIIICHFQYKLIKFIKYLESK